MENLKNALQRVLRLIAEVAKSYQDGKIVMGEWLQIGLKVTALIWIFKNLKAIKADFESSTEEKMKALIEELKVEFDIPQEKLEETIEQALSFVLLIFALIGKKVPQLNISQ